jgi:hypothetical protein
MAMIRPPWSPVGIGAFGGLPGFHGHMQLAPWMDPYPRGARWPYDPYEIDRCCELCDVLGEIVRSSL